MLPSLHKRFLVLVGGCVFLVAFAAWVWPTVYRDVPVRAPARIYAARQNRLTGTVDVLTAEGWLRLASRGSRAIEARTAAHPDTVANVDTGTVDPLAEYRRKRAARP